MLFKQERHSFFLLPSDFDQLPNNIPVSAMIADTEEKKGFIDYFVSLTSTPDSSLSLDQKGQQLTFLFPF